VRGRAREQRAGDSPATRVFLAQSIRAKLLTTDSPLAKEAELPGVTRLNFNLHAKSLRQELMIGERVEIYLVKPGKEDVPPGRFLADGAIVLVSGGRAHIGRRVQAEIIRVPDCGRKNWCLLASRVFPIPNNHGAGSSVDRARRSQRRGQRFDPAPVHHFVSFDVHGRTEEDDRGLGDHFE